MTGKKKIPQNPHATWVTCPTCRGTGTHPNSMHICPLCKGKKEVKAIK